MSKKCVPALYRTAARAMPHTAHSFRPQSRNRPQTSSPVYSRPVYSWYILGGQLTGERARAVSSVVGTVSGVIARVCARRQVSGAPWGGDPSADVWQAAQRRQNRAAMLRLQHIATGVEFVVGTYHMPCAFRTPAMMVIHAALVGQKVTRYRATWRRAGCVLV